MTAAERAIERAAEARAYWARSEAADPDRARRDRKYAAEKGWASEYDDPNVVVRASVLEELAAAAEVSP